MGYLVLVKFHPWWRRRGLISKPFHVITISFFQLPWQPIIRTCCHKHKLAFPDPRLHFYYMVVKLSQWIWRTVKGRIPQCRTNCDNMVYFKKGPDDLNRKPTKVFKSYIRLYTSFLSCSRHNKNDIHVWEQHRRIPSHRLRAYRCTTLYDQIFLCYLTECKQRTVKSLHIFHERLNWC